MPITRKPITIPPEMAPQFRAYMHAYHAEESGAKRGEIAAKARHMLLEHLPVGTKLRLTEVGQFFNELRNA